MASVNSEDIPRRLRRLRRFARLLDSALGIPGTRWRVGLDAGLGLVPVVGDLAGLALAAMIVIEARRLGADHATLVWMVLNIVADSLIGLIPVVGDVADAFVRMNERNVRLLERALAARGITSP